LLSNTPEDRQTVLIGPGDAAIIEIKWPYPGSYLFHPHGIEEENGAMGCFYVIPTSNSGAGEVIYCGAKPDLMGIPAQSGEGWKPAVNITNIWKPNITNLTKAEKDPVTDKSISMIDWQRNLQKTLQVPMCVDKNGISTHHLPNNPKLKDGQPDPTYERC
jgi:nitrite reductase (NO-forming)